MKYIKLFLLLAVVALGISSCSDDDEWNTTSGTEVSLPKQLTVRENTGLFKIPVTVKGAHNGKVKVTVSVTGTGDNPAVADSNYIVTSLTNVVSADTTSGEGFIEIETVDDDEINDNRSFNVTITSADGASIGNATCLVTIRDNDSQFYDKLQGKWTMTTAEGDSWEVNITGATDENDPDYNKTLYLSGMMGYAWTTAKLSYNYDTATKQGYVAFDDLGSYFFAEGVNFGDPIGVCNIILFSIEGQNLTTTPLVGHWSDDFKSITFEDGILSGGIFSSNNEFTNYVWFQKSGLKLTK